MKESKKIPQTNAEVQRLLTLLDMQNRRVEELEDLLNQKDGELSQKEEELNQKDIELNQQKEELSQKDIELNQQREKLSQKEGNSPKTGVLWRVTLLTRPFWESYILFSPYTPVLGELP